MQLNNKYQRENFIEFLEKDFLNDFKKDIRPVISKGLSTIQKAHTLGRSKSLDLEVFEFCLSGSLNKRISLTKDAFSIMKSTANFKSLAVFYSEDNAEWRISLMTLSAEKTDGGKAKLTYSNPKRYSYLLGEKAKINTPTRYLIAKGPVIDFSDLKSRFSLEVVNKDFYKEISELFTKLVGGTSAKGKTNHLSLLKLPFIENKSRISLEFAVRLIGRIIFCWFLREKRSKAGKSLMPKELLSLDAVNGNKDYYHTILEPIFFKVLNESIKSREESYRNNFFESIPYLNGGLFSPQNDDYFSSNEEKQAINHNIVVIPDIWFKELFSVLETYNFTIDENVSFDEELSIDPEMLGRIFENLLAEINPETGESARKSTGSYYTPRVIVEYMVDESICSYLQTQTKISEDKLRSIISYDFNDDKKEIISDSEKNKIIDALEAVKILDLACGSGAFPIGALQKIVFILQQVDTDGKVWFQKQIQNVSPEIKRVIEREFENENFDYIRKLGVVRKNIYGIDIQPIATEISRLRCFLTLIVDEGIHDELENRGIEPLPNLDFKFVTANSLIGLPKLSVNNQQGLFEDTTGIEELKDLREMFFNASGAEREELKLQFVQAQNRMFEKMITGKTAGIADLTTKLTTWKPFEHKASTWFESEWMFGIKDGFGIVIGNPPYVRQEEINYKEELKREYEIFNSVSDLYTYFYERGFKLLRDSGTLTFITSSKFLRARYGTILRKYLKENTTIKSIVNFGDQHMFEAITNTLIFIATKQKSENNTFNYSKNIDELGKIIFSQNELQESEWTIDNPEVISLKNKIEQQGKRLKYWDVKINRGVLTGYNEAFIIDDATRNELIKKDPKAKDIIKPIIRGRDIKRYHFVESGQYFIVAHNGYRNEGKQAIPAVDINNYPSIKNHLDKYIRQLKERQDKGYTVYNLRDCAFMDDFAKEKIIWIELTNENKFAYSDEEDYLLAGAFFLVGKSLKYFLAFLNSKLCLFYFSLICNSSGMATTQWKKFALEKVPVKELSDKDQKPFIKIVDKILTITKAEDYLISPEKQEKVKEYEKQIDQMVYKLYKLTAEEIKIVENENR